MRLQIAVKPTVGAIVRGDLMTVDVRKELRKMYAEMIASLKHQKRLMENEVFLTRDGLSDDTRAQIAICEDHIAELENLVSRHNL